MALTEELKSSIQAAYSDYLAKLGFKPRRGQRHMIAHIANTLGKLVPAGGIPPLSEFPPMVAIEAGTGTGKTLAYTLAAIPIAQKLEKKLVVATATVALQEQIVNRDFPSILNHSGLAFDFALAKGRRRYICNAKLARLTSAGLDDSQNSLAFGLDANVELISREGVLLYPELVKALTADQWDGDRDAWPNAIANEVWYPLTADNAECSGRKCPYITECCVYKAKNKVEEADVIVANHDIVLADIGLGGGVVLPPPEDVIYIFDEAHNLADKAINQFNHELRFSASRVTLDKYCATLATLIKDAAEVAPVLREAETLERSLADTVRELVIVEQHVQAKLDVLAVSDNDQERYRYPAGTVEDETKALCLAFAKQLNLTSVIANRLSQELEAIVGGDDPYGLGQAEAELWYTVIGGLAQRIEAMTAALTAMAAVNDGDGPPVARWLSRFMAGNREEVSISVCAVSAGDDLQQLLWQRSAAAVFTSATLRALGSFERFKKKTGLNAETPCEVVASPFDYFQNGVLRVPADFSPATARDEHSHAICREFYALIGDSTAVLVLFSARSQMNDCYDMLDSGLRASVLRQDDYTKQALIDLHRQTIDEGKRSIIFGLASLAEGLDLPGKYCDHVVIAKLPFAVPNDPVTETENEWYEQSGKNYFMEVSVPEAALKLVQASGRLLRTETDTGTITLLDNRVLTKRYGRDILNTLPPYRQDFSALEA